MGPMFSDTCSEVISGGSMFGAVGYLQCNPGQRVVPYNNWWWNVDSPLGSRHQTGVDAAETRQLSSTQEVPHSTSAEKSNGHNYLGLQRRAAGGFPTTNDNNDWTLLRWSADKSASGSEGEAEGNADPRSAVAARQCCGAHVSSCTGHSGHRVWAAVSPTLLTRPDTQRLLPISTSEAAPSQNEVFRWWWAIAVHGVVSRQRAPGILFDWNRRTFWQMSKVYWCTGRLYWKIRSLFCLCHLYIILNCKTFWLPLVYLIWQLLSAANANGGRLILSEWFFFCILKWLWEASMQIWVTSMRVFWLC